jgi:hypothetical protein
MEICGLSWLLATCFGIAVVVLFAILQAAKGAAADAAIRGDSLRIDKG